MSRTLVLTGAGMSAESGVPTFRDAQTGLWARFRPEDLATPEAFARDPATVWRWYAWRRELVARAVPHAGHDALARLQRRMPAVTLVTQNVDGLHQRAGSERVIELHGNIMRTVCSRTRVPIDEAWLSEHAGSEPPPSPHHPQGLARPDVVWFGEALPVDSMAAAMRAAEQCELCLVVGTSSLVHPAASLPLVARQHGARVVEINPEPTPLSSEADECIRALASVALPRYLDALS